MKNYYDILGVPKDATEKQIKAAYRRLAKKYHPDSAKNHPENAKKFQEISQAYKTLSNEKLRREYDYMGHSAYEHSEHFRSAPQDEESDDGHCGACRRAAPKEETPPPKSIRIVVWLEMEDTLKETVTNAYYTEKIPCPHCTGDKAKIVHTTCPDCGGKGRKISYEMRWGIKSPKETFCNRCHGSGKIALEKCPQCHGSKTIEKTWTFQVRIPKGAYERQFFVLQDQLVGEHDFYNQPEHADKLYILIVLLREKPGYTKRGYHLYTDLSIDFPTLVLGGTVTIPTIEGNVTWQIPPGTTLEQPLRLPGRGLIRPKKIGGRGDQYVHLHLIVPRTLSYSQTMALEHYRSLTT